MITSLLWKKPKEQIFWVVAPYDPYTRRDAVPGRKLEIVHPDKGTKHNCLILDLLDVCFIDDLHIRVLHRLTDSINPKKHDILKKHLKSKQEFQENKKEFKEHAKAIVLELIEIKENE